MNLQDNEKKIAELLSRVLNGKKVPSAGQLDTEVAEQVSEAIATARFLKVGFEPLELSPIFSCRLKNRLVAEAYRMYGEKKPFALRGFPFSPGLSLKAVAMSIVLIICIATAIFFSKEREQEKRLDYYHRLYQAAFMKDSIDELYQNNTLSYLQVLYDSEELKETKKFWHHIMETTENHLLSGFGDFNLDVQEKNGSYL